MFLPRSNLEISFQQPPAHMDAIFTPSFIYQKGFKDSLATCSKTRAKIQKTKGHSQFNPSWKISSNKASLYNLFLPQSNLNQTYIKSPLKYVKEIEVPSHVTFKTSQKLTPLFWSFYSIKQAGNGSKTQASFQFSLSGSSWLKWKQNKRNFFILLSSSSRLEG